MKKILVYTVRAEKRRETVNFFYPQLVICTNACENTVSINMCVRVFTHVCQQDGKLTQNVKSQESHLGGYQKGHEGDFWGS